MEKKTYGRTASGESITDDLVEKLAGKAETGYDVDGVLRSRGGRPPMGSAPASVESVRLDPELREALIERARRDDETTSAVIRKALRAYLASPRGGEAEHGWCSPPRGSHDWPGRQGTLGIEHAARFLRSHLRVT